MAEELRFVELARIGAIFGKMRGAIGAVDEQDDFAFGGMLGEVGEEFGGSAAVVGLEFFRKLTGDADAGEGLELAEDFQGGDQAVRGLEKQVGVAGIERGLEALAAFALFHGEKSAKREGVARKARADEGIEHGGGPREDLIGDGFLDAALDETVAGIRNARHAGIGDDGDVFAVADAIEQLGDAADLIVLVQGDERLLDAVVLEQWRGMAGVLAGDAVGIAEGLQGAQGDVIPMADGRRNERKAGTCCGGIRSHRSGVRRLG